MRKRGNPSAPQNLPSRREIFAGVALTLGSLAGGVAVIRAATGEEISHSSESIHMEPVFNAIPRRVYEALTAADEFNKVTQLSAAVKSGMVPGKLSAEISREVGGAFSMFDGFITGRQLELVPNERIVQAWRAIDWKPGEFSIVRFNLVEQNSGTKIVFDHLGFPRGEAQSLVEGWRGNYWEPLQKYFA